MAYNQFYGSITIDSDNSGITVDGGAITLTEGEYFIDHDTEAYSLLDIICSAIETESGGTVDYSISQDGLLTITSTPSVTLLFGSTLYETLGYTQANLSGTSIVATNYLKHCWFPELLVSDSSTPTSREGRKIGILSQQEAADNTVWTTKYGNVRRQELSYSHLSEARIHNLSDDNSSWEEFYLSTYGTGRKILFIPDSTDTSVYWYYVANLIEEPSPLATRSMPNTNMYWDLTLSFRGVDRT